MRKWRFLEKISFLFFNQGTFDFEITIYGSIHCGFQHHIHFSFYQHISDDFFIQRDIDILNLRIRRTQDWPDKSPKSLLLAKRLIFTQILTNITENVKTAHIQTAMESVIIKVLNSTVIRIPISLTKLEFHQSYFKILFISFFHFLSAFMQDILLFLT